MILERHIQNDSQGHVNLSDWWWQICFRIFCITSETSFSVFWVLCFKMPFLHASCNADFKSPCRLVASVKCPCCLLLYRLLLYLVYQRLCKTFQNLTKPAVFVSLYQQPFIFLFCCFSRQVKLDSIHHASESRTNWYIPRKGTSFSLAIAFPPSLEKILLISIQHGHIYPAIFSITPTTLVCVLTQKFNSFQASLVEIACGMVTTTAPANQPWPTGFPSVDVILCSSSSTAMCSLLVPGGATTRRELSEGQATSERNCRIIPNFLGSRQITALLREGKTKAKEIAWREPLEGVPFTTQSCWDEPVPFRTERRETGDRPQQVSIRLLPVWFSDPPTPAGAVYSVQWGRCLRYPHSCRVDSESTRAAGLRWTSRRHLCLKGLVRYRRF